MSNRYASDASNPLTWFFGAIFVVLGVFAVWAISAGVYAGARWAATTANYNEYSLSEYMEEFGFDPTLEYPVEIGRTVDGTAGSINGSMSIGLFFGRGSLTGSFNPTSNVTMSLPFEDGSNILMSIPVNRIVFHTADVENASISFILNDQENFGRTSEQYSYREGDSWFHFDAPVKEEIQPGPRESVAWDTFLQQSPDYWLLQMVERINLNLTAEQYADILNGNT